MAINEYGELECETEKRRLIHEKEKEEELIRKVLQHVKNGRADNLSDGVVERIANKVVELLLEDPRFIDKIDDAVAINM